MDRENLAKKIHWNWIIWTAGFVNIVAMIPQLWKVLETQKTESLSLGMVGTYLVLQIAFALEGYFSRSKVLLVSRALSAVVSVTLIAVVIYFRSQV
jgi:uncharacterized protein with PQ loop repeat